MCYLALSQLSLYLSLEEESFCFHFFSFCKDRNNHLYSGPFFILLLNPCCFYLILECLSCGFIVLWLFLLIHIYELLFSDPSIMAFSLCLLKWFTKTTDFCWSVDLCQWTCPLIFHFAFWLCSDQPLLGKIIRIGFLNDASNVLQCDCKNKVEQVRMNDR